MYVYVHVSAHCSAQPISDSTIGPKIKTLNFLLIGTLVLTARNRSRFRHRSSRHCFFGVNLLTDIAAEFRATLTKSVATIFHKQSRRLALTTVQLICLHA